MKKSQETEQNQKIMQWIHIIYQKRLWISGIFMGWIALGVIAFWAAEFFKKDPSLSIKKIDDQYEELITQGCDKETEFFKILESHAYLQPNYQGKIVQHFFNQGLYDKVWLFGEKICKRTSQELPLFHRYSMGTLLIANGKYEEALTLSKNLQQALDMHKDQYIYLQGLNILRIDLLEKLTKTKDKPLAYKRVKDFLLIKEKSTSKRDAFFVQSFQDLFKIPSASK